MLVKMYIYYFCYIFKHNFYAFIKFKFNKIIMFSHNAELKKKKFNGNLKWEREKLIFIYTRKHLCKYLWKYISASLWYFSFGVTIKWEFFVVVVVIFFKVRNMLRDFLKNYIMLQNKEKDEISLIFLKRSSIPKELWGHSWCY